MKRFVNYGLSLVLMASAFLVTSCGETAPEPEIAAPSLTITGAPADETTVEVGEEVSFTVNVTAPGTFNVLVVNKTADSEATQELDREPRTPGTTPTTYTYDFSYTAVAADAGKQLIFDFVAVDDQNKENSVSYTINVNEPAAIEEYETVLLGGRYHTTVESFYNAVENVKYFYKAANETHGDKVDFLFHYGDQNGNVISSPDNAETRTSWETSYELPLTNMNNSTRFKLLATTEYAAVTNSNQIENAYLENQNEVSRLTQLTVGEAFAFVVDEQRGGRYGVAEVAKIEGTDRTNRTITLNVKIQTEDNN